MNVHASGDFHLGDSLDLYKVPIQETPKSTQNTKRRSADFAGGDFDESFIVNEMKKLCNENNDFDRHEREESVKTDSSETCDESVKTDSSESSVDDYKKKIASDSYWSSKLKSQRIMAKRRTAIRSQEEGMRVRRILSDEPSFSQ